MSEFNGLYLDNVLLRMAAGCPTPQRVRVTRTTFDSVYATWSPTRNADTWLVYIGEPGFEIGSVTPYYVHSNSCAIGGLNPDTDYELVVVASCSGNEGYPSYPVPFHTLCAPLTDLPFVEDFEGPTGYTYPLASVNNLPDCWQYYNPTIEYSYRGYPIVYNDPTYAHSGRQSLSFRNNNIAIMPLTDATLFPASSLKVSLWISSEGQYAYVVAGVMSDPTDTNTFVAVDTVPVVWVGGIGYPYSQHTVKFLDYTGPHGYIAFKGSQVDWHSDQFYIDDIILEEMCPHIENLQVDYSTLGSITINWSGTGSHYEVDIKPDSVATWPDTPISVSDTTYTFTGLQPATIYQFRVRQDCSADTLGHSYWTVGSFDTHNWPCLTPDSLQVYDITNSTATFDWVPAVYGTAWQLHIWFSGGIDSIYTVGSHPASVGGLTPNITYHAAVRPLCGSDNNVMGDWGDTITFTTDVCPDVADLSASVNGNSVTLNWVADPLAESWEIEYGFQGFDQGTGTTTTSATNTLTIENLIENMSYDFHVRALCDTDWYSEAWTTVTATTETQVLEDCDPISDLTVADVTECSALITWTPDNRGEEWEVVLSSASGIILSEASTTEHQYLFGSLTPSTTYVAKVRTICDDDIFSIFTSTSFTTASAGIDEVSGASCTIYPNPTSDNMTVTVSGMSGRVTIAVVDLRGREVATATLDCAGACSKTMDVDRLAQGAYFVRITAEKVSMVRKLIVK